MQDKPDILTPQSARVLPWLVGMAFFMQMLDGTILNTALPGMARDLATSPLRMHSVVISYLLTAALVIPASGWLADRFGIRNVFVAAIGLFTLGSLFCALSPTLEVLVLSRVLQGLGGAIMVPVGRLVVLRAYPRDQLLNMLGLVTIPGMIGPLVGPMLGGFLVEYASWHWIFLVNLPVGLLGGLLALRYMPKLPDDEQGGFDWRGFFLFGLSLVMICLAMEGLGELRWPKVQAVLLLACGLMLMGFYWLRSANHPRPLFSLSLFATRNFTVGILGNLFSRLGSGAMPYLVPLFLQLALGFSPSVAGMTMIPSALAGIVGKKAIGSLVKRMGFRLFLAANTLGLGSMIACFSLITADTPYILLLCLFGVFGVINSMQFTAMNSITLIDLDFHHASSGNTLLSVVMQISASTGVAIAAALLDGFTQAYALVPSQGALLRVFTYTFICIGLLSLISTVIFMQIPAKAGKG